MERAKRGAHGAILLALLMLPMTAAAPALLPTSAVASAGAADQDVVHEVAADEGELPITDPLESVGEALVVSTRGVLDALAPANGTYAFQRLQPLHPGVAWCITGESAETIARSFPDDPGPTVRVQLLADTLELLESGVARSEDVQPWILEPEVRVLVRVSEHGLSADAIQMLATYGIEMQANPYRDDPTTFDTDEGRLLREHTPASLTLALHAAGHTVPFQTSTGQELSLQHLLLHAAPDWSLGALIAYVDAAAGDERALLHAPRTGHPDLQHVGDVYHARATPQTVAALTAPGAWEELHAAVPAVLELDLDHRFNQQQPLDVARHVTGTERSWEPGIEPAWNLTTHGQVLAGDGITVADFDTGIDIHHPAFFREAGTINWTDHNGDGDFDHGVDGLDLDGSGTITAGEQVERLVNGNGDNGPGTDTYYLDADNSGHRDFGPANNYDDTNDSYGELILQADDRDGDGVLEPTEPFIWFGESKVRGAWDPISFETVRGANMSQTGGDANGHGTSVQGIIAANRIGHVLAGQSPDVDLLSHDAFAGGFGVAQSWALQRGADVMLYEVGSWADDHLDGSSLVERQLDQMANAGVTQINPAGNLGGTNKVMQGELPPPGDPAGKLRVRFNVPSGGSNPSSAFMTLLLKDDARFGSVEIKAPGGNWTNITNLTGWQTTDTGDSFRVSGSTSSRNVRLEMFYLYRAGGLTSGVWEVRVEGQNGTNRSFLRGYTADSRSSWSGGVTFRTPIPSSLATRGNNGSVTWPATADHAITIGSWAPRGRSGSTPGQLSSFSSRGTRIHDAMPMVDIVSPGNYDIWSPDSDQRGSVQHGRYRWFSGTSAAGPTAASAAAIVMQRNPGMGHHEVWQAFNSSGSWNSTTGELWNASKVLNGLDPSYAAAQVAGAESVLAGNGTNQTLEFTGNLTLPYGAGLGEGLRAGDPIPGTLAPSPDWGWGYLRIDRAVRRDFVAPDIFAPQILPVVAGDMVNVTPTFTDNALDLGNVTFTHSCSVFDTALNTTVTWPTVRNGSSVGCVTDRVGTATLTITATDGAGNTAARQVGIQSIFGSVVRLDDPGPEPPELTAPFTTDSVLELTRWAWNRNDIGRPVTAAEWSAGLTLPASLLLQNATDGQILLDPIRPGTFRTNLTVEGVHDEVLWSIGLGAGRTFELRAVGFPSLFAGEQLELEWRWSDADGNRHPWLPIDRMWDGISGTDLEWTATTPGYLLNGTIVNASTAEAADATIGRWNGTEWQAIGAGLVNLSLNVAPPVVPGSLEPNPPNVNASMLVTVGAASVDHLTIEASALTCSAGDIVTVVVRASDPWGNPVPTPVTTTSLVASSIPVTRLDSVVETTPLLGGVSHAWRCLRAGEHVVAVSAAGLAPLAVNLSITPGPAVRLVTSAWHDDRVMISGQWSNVNATAFDAYDNEVPGTIRLDLPIALLPFTDPNSSHMFAAQLAGEHTYTVHHSNLSQQRTVTVVAATPSTVQVSPLDATIQLGESVALSVELQDDAGNLVPYDLSELSLIDPDPSVTLVAGRLHLTRGGAFEVTIDFGREEEAIGLRTISITVLGDRDGDGVGDDADAFPDDANLTVNLPEDGDGDLSDQDVEGGSSPLTDVRVLGALVIGGAIAIALMLAILGRRRPRGTTAGSPFEFAAAGGIPAPPPSLGGPTPPPTLAGGAHATGLPVAGHAAPANGPTAEELYGTGATSLEALAGLPITPAAPQPAFAADALTAAPAATPAMQVDLAAALASMDAPAAPELTPATSGASPATPQPSTTQPTGSDLSGQLDDLF